MWTTAGAIFSTTSAMKLNLYRGLFRCARPIQAKRVVYINDRYTAHSHIAFEMMTFLTIHSTDL